MIFEFGMSIENPQNQKIHIRFVEKTQKISPGKTQNISPENTAKNEQNPSRNGGFTVILGLSPK